MLTRSRFGFYANENAAANLKDANIIGTKGVKNVKPVTRTRAALGDLKNKCVDVVQKEAPTLKPLKKEIAIQLSNYNHDVRNSEAEKECDMSMDNDLHEAQAEIVKQDLSLLNQFRLKRKEIRSRCLSTAMTNELLSLDQFDIGDTATVYPYVESIFNYLQDRELSVQPLNADYMSLNKEVTPRMRYILVNWLVQVHYSYKLQPETLYLAVALLDRYLLKNSNELTKDCFQLVGIASLFIAAKFEEMYPPDISDFSSISNNAYSKSDIRNSEQSVLQAVDFFLSIPIPLVFLRRFSRALDANRTVHNLAKYFLELTIQEYDLAYLPGNLRAVMSLCLARAVCMETTELESAWCDKLSYLSGYDLDDIRGHLRVLARAAYRQNSPSRYRAIFNKYRQDDFYGRVAALPQLRSYLMETLADLKFDSDGEINQA